MSLVSIIVPVYKVEKYLSRCIESLLAQTYEYIEIILVDDGSPDACPEICDEYAIIDTRVKVIHKKNGGLSDARNTGLEASIGEWVIFIDSDDWVKSDFVERILDVTLASGSDIGVCNFLKVTEKNNTYHSSGLAKEVKLLSPIDALIDLYTYQRYGGVVTWNKIYKSSIFKLNDIRFPVGKIHEDNFTTYQTYLYAANIIYIQEELVFYLQREDSIMSEGFSDRSFDALEATNQSGVFIDSLGDTTLVCAWKFNKVMTLVNLLARLYSTKNYDKVHIARARILAELKPLFWQGYKNEFMRPRDRLRLVLSLNNWSYRVYTLFIKTLRKGMR